MLEAVCEKGIIRHARVMERSLSHIIEVCVKMQRVPNFLPTDNPISIFVNPFNLFFEVDDVGLVAVCPFGNHEAHVHVTFWDRRLRGREAICRVLAEWVVEQFGYHLQTVIPADRVTVIAFAKRVGFTEVLSRHGQVVMEWNPNYAG